MKPFDLKSEDSSCLGLLIAPVEKVAYVNVYNNGSIGSLFDSIEEAEENQRSHNAPATVGKLTWVEQ